MKTHIAIVDGLESSDPKDVATCAEAITEIAKIEPAAVAPYIGKLVPLLEREGKTRWEAMHAIALSSSHAPEQVEPLLGRLTAIIRKDKSVIMRDYAVDALAGYATTDPEAAKKALPILKEALGLWEHKHTARVLQGLLTLAKRFPKLRLSAYATPFLKHEKAGVRKAAALLAKS